MNLRRGLPRLYVVAWVGWLVIAAFDIAWTSSPWTLEVVGRILLFTLLLPAAGLFLLRWTLAGFFPDEKA